MSYQSCCCSKLNTIISTEVKTLWSTSYQSCTSWATQAVQQCAKWSWWLKWLCVLWQYVLVVVCLIWTTVTNVFWTLNAYASLGTCWSGMSYAVWSLNNILRINLANSLALGLGVNTPPNPIAKSGWNLSFNDEFTTPVLNPNKWFTTPQEANPFPLEPYLSQGTAAPFYWDASAVHTSGSTGMVDLTIELDSRTFPVSNWGGPILVSGQPLTWTIDRKIGYLVAKRKETWGEFLFLQRFGFFETRCRMPQSKATWPAFWMWGGMDWPPEIDVFEVLTTVSRTRFMGNIHWGADGQCFSHGQHSATHLVNDISAGFHIYGCEWDSCFVKWYYDNQLVRVAHDHVNHLFEPMRVVINNAIDIMNNPNDFATTLTPPAAFTVDYVRVYRR